jgi:hypothetical protein
MPPWPGSRMRPVAKSIPVKHDGEPFPVEACCFCGAPTCYWYTPRDVACCRNCAKTHKASEVPTKRAWMARFKEATR